MVNRVPGNKVVGLKQSIRAINEGKAKTVYLAKDADEDLFKTVEEASRHNSIEIVYIDTMKELGKLCNIDVKASTAVTLK